MSRTNGLALKTPAAPTKIRCAIYTRKSTEEGLDQEFNTLDAQRESGEAYIKSQAHEGWQCLPDHYDDGGYTGGNMERPALQRLMADIKAGRIDCIVVYKVDRLSRSLLDFARIIETFDRHNVSFVSVTQAFNTATLMGRLVLNVLLSFAQFEREIISERTRDKIAATRRKGKWAGGRPLLGYDVVDKKLVVHPEEAEQVRQIFYLYLEMQSLLAVVAELRRRSWTLKRWTTRKGTTVGGQPFTKTNLHQLLTNVAYLGRVRYKSEIHNGEHEAIVEDAIFDQVRKQLQKNSRSGGQSVRTKGKALLRGLLHCTACDCSMTYSYSTKRNRRYRYYLCANAQKQGWKACPSPSVPAGEIERFVMEQIKTVGGDPAVLQETLVQIASQSREGIDRRNSEREMVQRQLRDENAELHRLSTVATIDEGDMTRLAEVQERIRLAEHRLTEINLEIQRLRNRIVDHNDVATALTAFEPVWEMLSPREKARVLGLLVERVDFDGKEGNVAITFRSTGIRDLAGAHQGEERVA